MTTGLARTEWAQSLSEALKKWFETEPQYTERNRLAKELSIKPHIWEAIMKGSNIAQDQSIYARIYVRTKLPESDPRTLPDRAWSLPQGGTSSKPQAWSESEFQTWVLKQNKMDVETSEKVVKRPIKPRVTTQEKTPLHEVAVKIPLGALSATKNQTAGSILDELISKIGHDIGREILDNLRVGLRDESILSSEKEEGEGSEKDTPKGRVQAAFRMLNKEIAKIRDGQVADRDSFVTSYREEIGQLYAHLRVLAQEPEQREQSLQMKESTRHLDRR